MPRTALDFYKSHISPPDEVCRRFSLSEIQFSTQAFDERLVIGRGSFGKVYKCTIYHRFETIVVAMKRLNFLSSQGAPEFWAEVEMLGKLHHCNLVSLIGYCNEKQEMVLVYDYMKHGTLEDQLHKAENSPSWLQRLRICIDAAHGLNYLHTGTNTQHGVIHRDVKTSNILLDENFRAKISDFGLAKTSPTNQAHSSVSTQVKGTFGYIDPAYFYTGKLTRKSDVYAFGVVLLEVLCGRPAVDATLDEEQWGLVAWALDFIRKGKPNQIIDPRIRGQISPNCVKEFARVTISCLHDDPKYRPTMVEVVAKLGFILSLQERTGELNSNTTFIKKVRSLFGCKGYMKCNSWTLVDDDGSDSESLEEDIELLNTPVPVDVDNLKQEQDDSFPLILFDATSFFTMADLLRAPAENISRTGYSSIYRVRLDDGHHLVVKRLIKKFFYKSFEIQVSVHGKIRHKNIMPLQACYNHKSEALLIYTSSENGTLASFLNGGRRSKTAIGWPTRKKIIVGVTRGLVHLHAMEQMIHGNLTSGNVMLDKDCNPFIIDIGLSRHRINSRPDSSYNHAPELLYFKNASMETDVYSLGSIIFELLTRKSTHSVKHGSNMLNWVRSLPKEQWTGELFDAEIMYEAINNVELLCILQLAMNCTCASPEDRPKVDEVLQRLEEISATRKGVIRRRNARKRNMTNNKEP